MGDLGTSHFGHIYQIGTRHYEYKRNNLLNTHKTRPKSSIFVELRGILSQGTDMLLRFSVKNWMSFRDESTLDLVATREKQHSNHIATIEKYGLKMLPVAAIYGANASGKSNLIKALRFAERFIVDPPKADAPIPVKPFRLSKDSSGHPTSFRFDILIDETIYEYKFSVTASKVVEEELKKIYPNSEEILFRRGASGDDFSLSKKINEESEQHFAFRGTHDNQLYLTNSVSQKLLEFKPVFDWFQTRLVIVDPEMHFGGLPEISAGSNPHFNKMIKRLRDLDSGIDSICKVNVLPETVMPRDVFEQFSTVLKEGDSLPLLGEDEGLFVRMEKGKLIMQRVELIHKSQGGEEIHFNFSDESDGNRRLLELLPTFFVLEDHKYPLVFVIDELDRSLHSNLTNNLLERVLGKQRTSWSRSQLIFTTHDTQLMTQELFRRDEIWITERDKSGASKLIAFSEFADVRKDKDIRKSYLQGRMGGVPRIKTISTACEEEAAAR